jgi:spermidine/putrescine transport system permease protein
MLAISFARRGEYGVVLYKVAWSDYARTLETPPADAGPEAAAPKPAADGPAADRPTADRPSMGGYIAYLFANYTRAFEPDYLVIYWRSVKLALATTLACLLICYPVSYFIALKVPARWRNPLLMLVVIPFWTSFLVRTYAWILILRTEGIANGLAAKVHALLEGIGAAGLATFVSPPWPLLYNDFAVLAGLIYGELPFMILPLYASIQKLDLTLLEAAQDLGAGPIRTFLTVTLPLTRPGIVAGIIFVFIPSVSAFIIPDLLGGSKAMMVGNLVQNQFASTRDYPFGAAVSFLLTAIVFVCLWVNTRLAGKEAA